MSLAATSASSESSVLRKRIAPLPPGVQSTLGAENFTTAMPATMMEPSLRDQVSTALYNIAEANPPVAFAGRYYLLMDQRHGGQAVVQFARELASTLMQYAVKCASCKLHLLTINSVMRLGTPQVSLLGALLLRCLGHMQHSDWAACVCHHACACYMHPLTS